MSAPATPDVDELCFTARALAQTHPMTEQALRYRHARHAAERERQPATEIADWASTALLVGYCLRRSEEQAALVEPRTVEIDGDELEAAAIGIADRITADDGSAPALLAPDVVVAALDRLIATELAKREEHVREQLDQAAWRELEEYVTWWVIHGYCVRAAETG